jgi:NADH-quinone oxidoreductase subunit E
MLTEEERLEILAELRHQTHKHAACVEALKIVQRHRGWVGDEIRDIADILEMTPEELDGIATFYSLIFRKPVGKHIILICDSVSCWIMKSDSIRQHLTERLRINLGETSADGRFTLLPVACLGACDHAPAMMIDEILFTDLTPERIDEILGEYR